MQKLLLFFIISIMLSSCDSISSKRNNYNSSIPEDEWVEIEEEYEECCDYCIGDGEIIRSCSNCSGSGEKIIYHSGTRPKTCSNCIGTGRVRCETCGGYGYVRCEYCNGQGSFQCTVCHGYGIIILDYSSPHLSPKCNHCDGTGYEDCLACDGKGKIHCCNNGLANCPVCWGSGTYGQESYSEIETHECPTCNGSGRVSYYCSECDGTGIVIKTRVVRKKRSEL